MKRRSIAFAAACVLALLTTAGYAQSKQGQNHLSGQKSAYLERASHQPVNWYPLNATALKRARELNRPLLVDIGAIWCSWCGLMDRESYTQPEIAGYINQNFVAVKIDYDSDPQLDSQLEKAQALANLPSGLPLTIFVTPNGKLYYGGTYFPAKASGKKMAFADALRAAARMYTSKDAAIERDAVDLNLEAYIHDKKSEGNLTSAGTGVAHATFRSR